MILIFIRCRFGGQAIRYRDESATLISKKSTLGFLDPIPPHLEKGQEKKKKRERKMPRAIGRIPVTCPAVTFWRRRSTNPRWLFPTHLLDPCPNLHKIMLAEEVEGAGRAANGRIQGLTACL